MKMKKTLAWIMGTALSVVFSAQAATGMWDADVSDFPRTADETGDSARIMRAINAAGKGGVVWFPRGEYEIDSMLVISNQVSLLMHKSAHLKAVKEMPYVIECFYGNGGEQDDRNLFIKGGNVDGMGLASCAHVMGVRHFTMADSTFRNGKKFGLHFGDATLPRGVAGGYEIIANNLYFICNKPGLAGNVGLCTEIGDSHFTDIVVVDYTVGIRDMKWSNRFTRCHIWGGCVKKEGTNSPEYLPDSIAFDLHGDDAALTDCYADTAMVGFNLCGSGARISNCAYYNNWSFRMDNPTVFRHMRGALFVSGGRFSKNSPHATLYFQADDDKWRYLNWHDNALQNFTADEMKQLNDELKKSGSAGVATKEKVKLSE